MEFIASGKPKNVNTLGLLGYLIISNNQVHSYQLETLDKYLSMIGVNISETVVGDIIDGQDNAISYSSALSAYASEDDVIKRDVFYMLTVLALVDDVIDENESTIISDAFERSGLSYEDSSIIKQHASEEAESIRATNNTIFIRRPQDKKRKENWFRRLLRWILNFFGRILHVLPKETDSSDSQEYVEAIKKCATVAIEDLAALNPIYSHIIDSCACTLNEIRECKNELSLENGYSAEVAEVIDCFVDILKNDVLAQSKQARSSLDQKRRTVSDFSISLLGRTKSGKSTLHAILTNQGRDKIGAGKQRTTRYNRVYQWNLLRLIDTPGIGSAEAEGRTDDEIAESVLGESDIICFVVADDTILDDILDFIKKTSGLNKPIIVLLNHKENIRPEVKFNRFLGRPREWLETEGEANLRGHINRIQRYADENGFGELIKVYPVFLLPALMASESEYSEYSDMLWESSNIEEFIKQLETWITVCGTIKRSQTILDEAIQELGKSVDTIAGAQDYLLAQKNNLIKKREKEMLAIKESENRACVRTREILEEKFDKLGKQEAWLFAEEEYDKKCNHSEHWNQFIRRIGFEDEVNDAVNQAVREYSDKVSDVINTLFEELYYSAKIPINSHQINIPIQFDFRTASRVIGGIAGTIGAIIIAVLGASNPVGWVITAVGIALELGAGLFSTKEQKRRNAIKKIYDAVNKSIDESAPKAIEKIVFEIKKHMNESTHKIEILFSDLENGMDRAITLAAQLKSDYCLQRDTLNRFYACRLINYVKENDNNCGTIKPESILSVDRSQPGKIIIGVTGSKENYESFSLEEVIAEKILIEWKVAS